MNYRLVFLMGAEFHNVTFHVLFHTFLGRLKKLLLIFFFGD